jgi:hypothetical protein
MTDIFCYSYVEDAPSAAVAKRLVASRNSTAESQLLFCEGFPSVMSGYGEIKKKSPAFLNMAKAGIRTFTLTDLDTRVCAVDMIRDWFAIPDNDELSLPDKVIFRVAVREVESWILADRAAWSQYIGIPACNFSAAPDSLCDPKQHLLDVVRTKGNRKVHKEMLPTGSANVGPRYNEVLCTFVESKWSPTRASANSPSLDRAIRSLLKT